MLSSIRLRQTGDTIIEVMIAIAILSAMLGGAFAISNRSQKAAVANHERYQAQLYINEQAELLRKASATDRDALISKAAANQTFCMTSAGVFVDETDTNCSDKAGLYTIVVTAQKDCNFITTGCTKDTYNTFDIKITWDSFVRSGKDQLELVYGI